MLVKIQNVSKIYGEPPNELTALDNVSLEIKKGEFVAIVGPSGSGKSTLMNILGCLDKPSHGKYFLEDQLVSQLSQNQLAKIRNQKLGFVFQSFNLLPRTSALKNVELPLIYANVKKPEREQRSKSVLEKVGLADKLGATPAKLSGGQQQRVAIARALVNEPSILFADEPTGNLDTKSSAEIMKILQGLNREGKTVIIITHEREIAQFAGRTITIRDGKIISDSKRKKGNKYLKRK
jgi:putative ABC transport system ATP-binding protein